MHNTQKEINQEVSFEVIPFKDGPKFLLCNQRTLTNIKSFRLNLFVAPFFFHGMCERNENFASHAAISILACTF